MKKFLKNEFRFNIFELLFPVVFIIGADSANVVRAFWAIWVIVICIFKFVWPGKSEEVANEG